MRSSALFFLFVFFSLPAWAQIEIENPWSRATAPGARIAAGYMTIRNKSATADRLVGGTGEGCHALNRRRQPGVQLAGPVIGDHVALAVRTAAGLRVADEHLAVARQPSKGRVDLPER